MTILSVEEKVNHNIFLELLPVDNSELKYPVNCLNVVSVNMYDGHPKPFDNIGAISGIYKKINTKHLVLLESSVFVV
jgi:hypothetical protein